MPVQVSTLDEQALNGIMRALRKVAFGKRVSFSIEEGVTRHRQGGKVIETPNGTFTFRLDVNGGAVDMGLDPEAQP